MSAFSHNDINAEKLALGWHWAGVAVSVAAFLCHTALFTLIWAEIFYDQMFNVLVPVAVYNMRNSGIAIHFLAAVLCGCGTLWHMWAVKQHREHLRALRRHRGFLIMRRDGYGKPQD